MKDREINSLKILDIFFCGVKRDEKNQILYQFGANK